MKKEITSAQRLKKNSVARVPPRVAPHLRTEVKRMRIRDKKNSFRGRK